VVRSGLVRELQAELASQWSIPATKQLTPRESEIIRYVSMGLSNVEVAERLAISEGR